MKPVVAATLVGLLGACAPSLAAAATEIRINAGGSNYTDINGKLWSADYGYNTGKTANFSKTSIAGTDDDPLYQTLRWDELAAPELNYTFSVPNGDYTVKLHFAESNRKLWKIGARVFDVLIEGNKVADNLDIFAAVGANAALARSFPVSVGDGNLQIDFLHQTENPLISAIEIVQAPTATTDAKPVANNDSVAMTSSAWRINAGGGAYMDGAGNSWAGDFGFNTGSTANFSGVSIGGTSDDPLYQTLRWDALTAPELNYTFSVPNGDYTVKLHFAESNRKLWKIGARVFDVLIEGNKVADNLDIFAAVGANAALVRSFPVAVGDDSLQIDFLHQTENPLICGIEILGMAASGATPTASGASVTIDPLANDTGLADKPVTLTVIGLPSNGSVTVNADNTLVYTPKAGFTGTDAITYQITDANGDSATGTVNIQVECTTCSVDPMLKLSWNPVSGTVAGYKVYFGSSPEGATQEKSDLPLNSGLLDPTAPSVQYRAQQELGLATGDQACFRVKAYNGDGLSDYSAAACQTL